MHKPIVKKSGRHDCDELAENDLGSSYHKIFRPAGESFFAGGKSAVAGGLVTRAGGLVGPPAG